VCVFVCVEGGERRVISEFSVPRVSINHVPFFDKFFCSWRNKEYKLCCIYARNCRIPTLALATLNALSTTYGVGGFGLHSFNVGSMHSTRLNNDVHRDS
jgi:hypothetical protein